MSVASWLGNLFALWSNGATVADRVRAVEALKAVPGWFSSAPLARAAAGDRHSAVQTAALTALFECDRPRAEALCGRIVARARARQLRRGETSLTAVATCLGRFASERNAERLALLIESDPSDDELALAALAGLAKVGGPGLGDRLRFLLRRDRPAEVRRAAATTFDATGWQPDRGGQVARALALDDWDALVALGPDGWSAIDDLLGPQLRTVATPERLVRAAAAQVERFAPQFSAIAGNRSAPANARAAAVTHLLASPKASELRLGLLGSVDDAPALALAVGRALIAEGQFDAVGHALTAPDGAIAYAQALAETGDVRALRPLLRFFRHAPERGLAWLCRLASRCLTSAPVELLRELATLGGATQVQATRTEVIYRDFAPDEVVRVDTNLVVDPRPLAAAARAELERRGSS